jgi:hypothetical protein
MASMHACIDPSFKAQLFTPLRKADVLALFEYSLGETALTGPIVECEGLLASFRARRSGCR